MRLYRASHRELRREENKKWYIKHGREYYFKNRERILTDKKIRLHSENGRKLIKEQARRAKEKGYKKKLDPQKEWARRKLQYAVKMGRVVQLPCAVCGDTRTHAHHHDYNNPIDVKWLCRTHHSKLHRKNT